MRLKPQPDPLTVASIAVAELKDSLYNDRRPLYFPMYMSGKQLYEFRYIHKQYWYKITLVHRTGNVFLLSDFLELLDEEEIKFVRHFYPSEHRNRQYTTDLGRGSVYRLLPKADVYEFHDEIVKARETNFGILENINKIRMQIFHDHACYMSSEAVRIFYNSYHGHRGFISSDNGYITKTDLIP